MTGDRRARTARRRRQPLEWAADPDTGHDDDRPLDEVGHEQVVGARRRCCRCSSRPGSTRRRWCGAWTRWHRSACRCGPTRCSPRRPRAAPTAVAGRLRALVAESGRIVVAQSGRRDPGRSSPNCTGQRDREPDVRDAEGFGLGARVQRRRPGRGRSLGAIAFPDPAVADSRPRRDSTRTKRRRSP